MNQVETSTSLDQALAEYMLRTRMALPAQIQDAKDSQSMAAEHGMRLPLGEALVRLGIITAQQRISVEALLKEDNSELKQVGNYRLIKKLGAGMMGAVYLAEDTLAKRQVALKILAKKMSKSKELIERFKREAQAAGRLNHLNIVTAFAVDSDAKRGIHFYVMEYCDGESLEGILKREDYLLEPMALDIVLQVTRGLEHAHKNDIVHRDIKPGNIMLNSEGVAKVMDMGLSKSIANDEEQSFKTQSGLAVGTPHYMSPEQIRGDEKIDGRADIYSLGATLYHFLTGKPPYAGENPNTVMTMHLSDQIPNPQDIRPELSDNVVLLIERMLAKSRKDRYQNCAELLSDILLVIDGRQPQNKPTESFKSSIAPRRSWNAKISAVRDRVIPPRTEKAIPAVETQGLKTRPAHRRPAMFYALLTVVAGLTLWVLWLLIYGENPFDETVEATAAQPIAAEEKSVKPNPALAAVPAAALSTSTGPAAVPALPATAPRAIDLFPLIDIKKNTITGPWQTRSRELYINAPPNTAARLEIAYRPPEEYDFKVVFTRASGNGDVNAALVGGGRQFLWMMNGYGGHLCGFEILKGNRLNSPNNASRVLYPLENGKRYTLIAKVRKDRVEIWFNEKQLGSLKNGYKDLSVPEWWKFRDESTLGLGVWSSAVIFHTVEIVPLSGAGILK